MSLVEQITALKQKLVSCYSNANHIKSQLNELLFAKISDKVYIIGGVEGRNCTYFVPMDYLKDTVYGLRIEYKYYNRTIGLRIFNNNTTFDNLVSPIGGDYLKYFMNACNNGYPLDERFFKGALGIYKRNIEEKNRFKSPSSITKRI